MQPESLQACQGISMEVSYLATIQILHTVASTLSLNLPAVNK